MSREDLIMEIYLRLPDWESCIADLEQCIKADPYEWKRYLKDRTPYLCDLLSDFGEFSDMQMAPYKELGAYIKKLVKAYLNK